MTRVSRVPNTNDSVFTDDAADSAWTNRRSSREWRSIEPEMSHRTTIWRGRLVGRRQTHSVNSPPVARLRRNIARGASSAAVVVELVAARPAQLEARLEQVDQPLGVAQLGRRHPVEVAVAEQLGRRCTRRAPR